MGIVDADGFAAAGCDERLVGRLQRRLALDDVEGCLQLLRAHRCELVEAMHEAQRPIDVCDWIIEEMRTYHA